MLRIAKNSYTAMRMRQFGITQFLQSGKDNNFCPHCKTTYIGSKGKREGISKAKKRRKRSWTV